MTKRKKGNYFSNYPIHKSALWAETSLKQNKIQPNEVNGKFPHSTRSTSPTQPPN
ncbi:hypothetical protein ACMA1I_18740 [Pontibacter sp. 13R65]|uniref:hypothetical protein n=1 Tax=Pontibacter sp. 13R65 TaxID=3127458 RepID=UPI00301CF851